MLNIGAVVIYLKYKVKIGYCVAKQTNEPHHEKSNILHMRKQRRRSANQRLCFRYIDNTIPLLPKYEISSL